MKQLTAAIAAIVIAQPAISQPAIRLGSIEDGLRSKECSYTREDAALIRDILQRQANRRGQVIALYSSTYEGDTLALRAANGPLRRGTPTFLVECDNLNWGDSRRTRYNPSGRRIGLPGTETRESFRFQKTAIGTFVGRTPGWRFTVYEVSIRQHERDIPF